MRTTTRRTSSAITRPARSGRRRRDLPRPSTGAARPLRILACSRRRQASTPRAMHSSGRTAAGTGRWPWSVARPGNRLPTAGSRSAPTRCVSSSSPARRGRSCSCSATARTRRTAKFDPPGSGTLDTRRIRPVIARQASSRRGGCRRWAALHLAALLGAAADHDGQRAPRPDGERLEHRTSAWSRSTCRARRRCSRAGSARDGLPDSNQDLLGFVHMVPERARERILDIAATQLPDGGACHQYQPLTKRGNDAVGSGFNDDPAWLVLAVAAYLRETGDAGDPRRAGRVRQHAGVRAATGRSPAPGNRATRLRGSGRTGCR